MNKIVLADSTNTCFDTDTVLMAHMNGTDGSTSFIDSSNSAHSFTVGGNAQIDTAQSQFGGASYLSDGTTDYLAIASNSDFTFSTNNFTIDLWLRINSSKIQYIIDFRDASQTEDKVAIYLDSSNFANLYVAGAVRITSSSAFTNNVWGHLALVRSGSTTTMYKDGTSVGTWADSTNYAQGQMWLGEYPLDNSYSFNGWMDEVRIVKGTAVWTTNFTAPTAEYTACSTRRRLVNTVCV